MGGGEGSRLEPGGGGGGRLGLCLSCVLGARRRKTVPFSSSPTISLRPKKARIRATRSGGEEEVRPAARLRRLAGAPTATASASAAWPMPPPIPGRELEAAAWVRTLRISSAAPQCAVSGATAPGASNARPSYCRQEKGPRARGTHSEDSLLPLYEFFTPFYLVSMPSPMLRTMSNAAAGPSRLAAAGGPLRLVHRPVGARREILQTSRTLFVRAASSDGE